MYLITGNEHKLLEFKTKIANIEQIDIDLTEIQAETAEEVIEHKLEEALKVCKPPFIVEDTAWYIEGLNDFPGVYAKWFHRSLGINKIADIVEKLNNNKAYTQTIIGYVDENHNKYYFFGTVHGEIVQPRGEIDFGFDKIFMPEGSNKTFGEMSKEEKTNFSMRGIAIDKLLEYINE